MRILIFMSAVVFLFILSCETTSSDESTNDIKGNWFYIDKSDTSYNELYFTENLHFYNLSSSDVGTVLNYEIVNDSLFISRDGFNEHRVLLFRFVGNQGGNMLTIFSRSDTITLEPLLMPKGVFYDLHAGSIIREELTKGRLKRGSKVFVERGLSNEEWEPIIEMQDSIAAMPTIEESENSTPSSSFER